MLLPSKSARLVWSGFCAAVVLNLTIDINFYFTRFISHRLLALRNMHTEICFVATISRLNARTSKRSRGEEGSGKNNTSPPTVPFKDWNWPFAKKPTKAFSDEQNKQWHCFNYALIFSPSSVVEENLPFAKLLRRSFMFSVKSPLPLAKTASVHPWYGQGWVWNNVTGGVPVHRHIPASNTFGSIPVKVQIYTSKKTIWYVRK